MQSIDVVLVFMFFFSAVCIQHGTKIHPAWPNKYSILNIWFILKNVNGKMSIQLNCSIGGCRKTSNTYYQRIEPSQRLRKTFSDLCVEFSRCCLAPLTIRMNEWMNEQSCVCDGEFISKLTLFYIIENLIHKQTAHTQTRTRTHAYTHTFCIQISNYTHEYVQPSTINMYYILVFITQGTYYLTYECALWNVAGSQQPQHRLLASDKSKMDSHLLKEIFLRE